jgi:phosphoserine phosphatase
MLFALVLVAADAAALAPARARADQAIGRAQAWTPLGPTAVQSVFETTDAPALKTALNKALAGVPVDLCLVPENPTRRKRLFVADMDSTIIGCECLDELADFAGVKAEVSAITERAMRGEIDFADALKARVGMLKGLPAGDLQRCFDDRVGLNPGARTLVATMAAQGVRCVLVSGGFDFFTSRVARAAGFQAERANHLIEEDGRLTGRVREPILGREAKLAALCEEAAALGLDPSAALAVGDGANDLGMIEAAGLGVAYRAKPVVADQADARVDHADLTALLYFQGYRAEEFQD